MKFPAHFAYWAVFIGVCGHASSEFFAVLTGLSGPEVSVWRYLLGGLGLVVAGMALSNGAAMRAALSDGGLRFVMVSLIGVSATYLAFHWALDFATVIQVATVVTTIPIFVALANWVVNGERPGAVKLVTGALAVLGVALLITDGAVSDLAGAEGGAVYGVLLAAFCAAAGSFYSVLIKPDVGRHGALPVTAVSLMIGGIGLWVAVGLGWGLWVDPTTLFDRPAQQWSNILILALWNTTIGMLFWIGGLAAAPDITRASYLFFLKPVIAAVLALFILGQPITTLQSLAIVVVTGSVFVEMFWTRIESWRSRATTTG
ncbi:MAG: DMT family transporter [Pseudomonadota bacterium]